MILQTLRRYLAHKLYPKALEDEQEVQRKGMKVVDQALKIVLLSWDIQRVKEGRDQLYPELVNTEIPKE